MQAHGVQVQTGVTVTLNAELRVGGLQETITVTGETPVVDVQNSTRVQTRARATKSWRRYRRPAATGICWRSSSGIQANGTQNGGVNPGMIFFTSRGGRSNEGTVQIDGMNVGSAFNGGGVAGYGYDTVQRAGSAAHRGGRARRGRPRRAAVQHHSQDRRQHVQRDLLRQPGRRLVAGQQRGRRAADRSAFPSPTKIIRNWDTSFSMGGPIKRDRVWFYGTARTFGEYTDIAGRFGEPERRRPDELGLRRRSKHHVAHGQQPENRSAGASRRSCRRGTRSAPTIDNQMVCDGSSYAQDAEQCRDAR